MRRVAPFTKADIARLVAGAIAGGMAVGRLEAEAGKVILYAAPADAAPADATNDFDKWMAGRGPRQA